jgi:hypothetical protein
MRPNRSTRAFISGGLRGLWSETACPGQVYVEAHLPSADMKQGVRKTMEDIVKSIICGRLCVAPGAACSGEAVERGKLDRYARAPSGRAVEFVVTSVPRHFAGIMA